jgi:hypothetical protein
MAPPAPAQILELALSLEVEQLPIAGTLRRDARQPEPFDGWLELIAAIETALKAARRHSPPTEREGKL